MSALQVRPVSDLANVAKSVCSTRVVLNWSLVGQISLEVAMFRWIAVADPMVLVVPAAYPDLASVLKTEKVLEQSMALPVLKFLTPLRWGGWVFRVSRTVG